MILRRIRTVAKAIAVLSAFLIPALSTLFAFPQSGQPEESSVPTAFSLENAQVRCTVKIVGGKLISDRLETQNGWVSTVGGSASAIETNADFAVDLMYTDWNAPGKANNADNLITLTKNSFSFERRETTQLPNGRKELALYFNGIGYLIQLRITYALDSNSFYVRRNIALLDTAGSGHFVRFFWPRAGEIEGVTKVVKEGGFGQPIALLVKSGGAFFGAEYPASDNRIEKASGGNYSIRCGAEVGHRIGKSQWLESDWAVEGITPDPYVKLWFNRYVNDIRVAPLRPFSLYNTWYDLRSPEYPRWPKENVMSEQTALKMVNILRRNMIEKHRIKLDAFVLDDGWDVYKSDWVLRKEQWPNGLKPLADELAKTGTSLGVWMGPTGGYSLRMQRVGWMRDHGYETVGDMLCVAGKNYSALLRQRIGDFVGNDGVGYFKWDGIQFSCSEPNHGHPVDVYSRRAVLQSVAAMCKTARDRNPNVFLNITSGTWMSPWWVEYANTIWMQGADYGFADVPSISMRDGAITYRDFVLYEDWKLKDLWFPIANLMTHGIIKGKPFSVGAPMEPLDKFTDDVLLYFARGVAMYELYISPDILSDGEWTSISGSMAWARKNFDILMNTELVGGNPMKGQSYGYVHFKGNRGIIAARNPVIEASKLDVELAVSQGFDPKATGIVIQRIYPTRWISPNLYRAGDKVSIPLDGFETAVYELYPVSDATEPLLAGAVFGNVSEGKDSWHASVFGPSQEMKILNPSILKSAEETAKSIHQIAVDLKSVPQASLVKDVKVRPAEKAIGRIEVSLTVADNSSGGMVAVLLAQGSNSATKVPLNVTGELDGKDTPVSTEFQEGKSQWYKVAVAPGKHTVSISMKPEKDGLSWQGKATAWFVSGQLLPLRTLEVALKSEAVERVLPPVIWPVGEIRKNVRLGELEIPTVR